MKRKTMVITPKRANLKKCLLGIVLGLFVFFLWQNGLFAKILPVFARLEYSELLSRAVFWQEDSEEERNLWDVFIGYDPTKPDEQLTANIYLDRENLNLTSRSQTVYKEVAEEYYWDSTEALSSWDEMKEKFGQVHLSEEVQVLIYHTHNAETYNPSYGVSKQEGQNGGVVMASDVLTEALERKYGIRTVHNKTLHDYPNWSHSYINSLKTINGLLNSYPTAKVVFDIHRDAGYTSKDPTTAVINGKAACKILLVVGANHDNYQSNLAFAQALEDKAEQLYPGLMKGIHIAQSSRYNQQVHEHSVIVEVGSDLNTQEEANYAMELFADVCASVIKDMG